MLKIRLMKAPLILALAAIVVASCGGGNVPDATPTVGVDQIQTQAVATFSSAVTLTALAAPTNTLVPTPTIAPTLPALSTPSGGTPLSAGTPGIPVSGGVSTASCYKLTFVKDVTIPDNTKMDPGESFTKTWQVLNSGSCAWDAGFKFQNSGGVSMGASTLTLPSMVASGATFDLSVPMTAPTTAGSARSNWRMSTAGGQLFGDEIYVQIMVGGAAAAATNTSAPTTQTATAP